MGIQFGGLVRPGESLLLIGALGAAIYFVAKKKTGGPAASLPQGEDCIRMAAKATADKIPKLLTPVQIAPISVRLRSMGYPMAADCLDKLAAGQSVDCASLLVGPFEADLRRADPATLRFIASKMRLLKLDTIADCLEQRANQLPQGAIV